MKLLLLICFVAISMAKEVRVIVTAKDTTDRLTEKTPLEMNPITDEVMNLKNAQITIQGNITYQSIFGFGGAFTEAASVVFSQLLPALQEEILQAYFGPRGQQYTVGRLHINSCDFSVQSYSYCDTPNDFELSTFNMSGTPDEKYIFPFLRRALALSSKKVNLFASPWSPPAWMKINEQMVGSSFPRGLKRGPQYERTWALYFSKYISAIKERGFELWAVTLQNEPMAPHFTWLPGAWESCTFFPRLQRDFLKDWLGPTLERDHPEVKIIVHDSQKPNLYHDSQVIMDDPDAAKYVAGFGIHWYTGGEAFDIVKRTAELYPDRFIFGTEACEGFLESEQGPRIGNWERGEHYGHDVLNDLESYAVGWMDWNMVLNLEGGPNHVGNLCDAPIIADITNQILYFQSMYYYMGHFTRYLPQNSVRIGHLNTEASLETTAFQTPAGETVLIVLNRNEVEFNVTVVDSQSAFTDIVLPRSIKTYIYPSF